MNMNLMLLVNKEHLLGEHFTPARLITIVNRAGKDIRIVDYVWESFKEMMLEGEKNDQYLSIVSAYRNFSSQAYIYLEKLSKFGSGIYKVIPPPGSSEHQLGLGIDVANYTRNNIIRDDDDQFNWLHANCSKYGFIVRYKKEFEEVTDICYKPWHLRYVGKENAQYIEELNLPLEEIVKQTSDLTHFKTFN